MKVDLKCSGLGVSCACPFWEVGNITNISLFEPNEENMHCFVTFWCEGKQAKLRERERERERERDRDSETQKPSKSFARACHEKNFFHKPEPTNRQTHKPTNPSTHKSHKRTHIKAHKPKNLQTETPTNPENREKLRAKVPRKKLLPRATTHKPTNSHTNTQTHKATHTEADKHYFRT